MGVRDYDYAPSVIADQGVQPVEVRASRERKDRTEPVCVHLTGGNFNADFTMSGERFGEWLRTMTKWWEAQPTKPTYDTRQPHPDESGCPFYDECSEKDGMHEDYEDYVGGGKGWHECTCKKVGDV